MTYLRPYIACETRGSGALLRGLDMLLQVGRVDDNLMELLVEIMAENDDIEDALIQYTRSAWQYENVYTERIIQRLLSR